MLITHLLLLSLTPSFPRSSSTGWLLGCEALTRNFVVCWSWMELWYDIVMMMTRKRERERESSVVVFLVLCYGGYDVQCIWCWCYESRNIVSSDEDQQTQLSLWSALAKAKGHKADRQPFADSETTKSQVLFLVGWRWRNIGLSIVGSN